MTKGRKILLGVLSAAAAGVAIGILIAPEKGKDMRKKLKKTANDWADNLSHIFVKAENIIENGKHKTKSAIEEKASKLKESLS